MPSQILIQMGEPRAPLLVLRHKIAILQKFDLMSLNSILPIEFCHRWQPIQHFSLQCEFLELLGNTIGFVFKVIVSCVRAYINGSMAFSHYINSTLQRIFNTRQMANGILDLRYSGIVVKVFHVNRNLFRSFVKLCETELRLVINVSN
jgi:hypothetical protein